MGLGKLSRGKRATFKRNNCSMAFKITPQSLRKLCKENNLYSSDVSLNEILHLQCKGITELAPCIGEFTGLKTLYLEQNALSDLSHLAPLTNLRCLYLGRNMIDTINGLENLIQLDSLDLSDNYITMLSGLNQLGSLRTLNLSGNKLATCESIRHLKLCSSLISLDLANNKIADGEAVDMLAAMPLSFLRLAGNPVVGTYRHYRKSVLSSMENLNYLDDSPVFPKDRRLAVAFVTGGLEAERGMREQIRKEEDDTRERHRKAFDEMVDRAKASPPIPHDPMRFRALPVGESESDDDDLPPSYRKPIKCKASVPPPDSTSGKELSLDPPEEVTLITQEGGNLNEELSAASRPLMVPEPTAVKPPSVVPTQDFKAELHERAIARATARAEAAASMFDSGSGSQGLDLSSDLGAPSIFALGGLGSVATSAARAASARSDRPHSARTPKVWGTTDYRRLWQMAVEVGEHQEAQLREDEGSGPSSMGAVLPASTSTQILSRSPMLTGESGTPLGRADSVMDWPETDDVLQTVSDASMPGGLSPPSGVVFRPPSIVASTPRPRAAVMADSALSEADLDSALSHGRPSVAIPDIDMDSARDGLNDEDVNDSALSSADFSPVPLHPSITSAENTTTHTAPPVPNSTSLRHRHLEHLGVTPRPGDTDSAREDEDEESTADAISSEDDAIILRSSDSESDHENVLGRRDLFERYTISSVGLGGLSAVDGPPASSRSSGPHGNRIIQRVDSASEHGEGGGLVMSSLSRGSFGGTASASTHQPSRERSAGGTSRLRQESSDLSSREVMERRLPEAEVLQPQSELLQQARSLVTPVFREVTPEDILAADSNNAPSDPPTLLQEPYHTLSGTLHDPGMLAQARAAFLGLGRESESWNAPRRTTANSIQRYDSVASVVTDPQGLYDLD